MLGIQFNVATQTFMEFLNGNVEEGVFLRLLNSPIALNPGMTDADLEPFEVSVPGYNPFELDEAGLLIGGANPGPYFGYYSGIAFTFPPYIAPQQTVYGWWISCNSTSGANVAMYGGLLDTPWPIPLAGSILLFDNIRLDMHDCSFPPPSPPPPFAPYVLSDAGFEEPVIGSDTFVYTPAGTAWNYTFPAGILSNGSAFAAPPVLQGDQAAFIQSQGQIGQELNGTGGTYYLAGLVCNRATGGSAVIEVEVDGLGIDTISSVTTTWVAYNSPTFSVSAGSHSVSFVSLTVFPPTDATLFIDNLALVCVAGP
jgi:hypothetical protein